MPLTVDVATERVRLGVSRAHVADAARAALRARRVRAARLSITFVSRPRMATMNRTHLGRRGATDVIAFCFDRASPRDPLIGDIYIVITKIAGPAVGLSAAACTLVLLVALWYAYPLAVALRERRGSPAKAAGQSR